MVIILIINRKDKAVCGSKVGHKLYSSTYEVRALIFGIAVYMMQCIETFLNKQDI